MDEVTWAALAWTLTLLGGAWTWYAYRHRGLASGLRGAGLTLLPLAAWLTGTLELASEIGTSVADWAGSLVLSPSVWVGAGLAGVAAVLLVVSGIVRERQAGVESGPREVPGTRPPHAVGPASPAAAPVDDEMAEIEALLRKRGIT